MKSLAQLSCWLIVTAPSTSGWVSVPITVQRPVSTGTIRARRPPLHHEAHSSQDTASSPSTNAQVPSFILKSFTKTECDDLNTPPSLCVILDSLDELAVSSGTDIRGRFVEHAPRGSLVSVAHAIQAMKSSYPALTPFAAYCYGYALAKNLWGEKGVETENNNVDNGQQPQQTMTIAVGIDPRTHGLRLADAFARGAESFSSSDSSRQTINVVFVGIATTPACATFCRSGQCDAAVMITASHLPPDRNGFKFFSPTTPTGFTKIQVRALAEPAKQCAAEWYNQGILPPSSGDGGVMCSQHDRKWMSDYAESLKQAILAKTTSKTPRRDSQKPLEGLKILLNAGNGSGGFFQNVLEDLGADASFSQHLEPDAAFPNGVPNPESSAMLEQTILACQEAQADLGIMLDTDADRCGFVVPRGQAYEPLNRNRLIALLAVVFARTSPGCAVVTDSVTSEGLSTFLQDHLHLQHVRYLKGYANVINKAKELTESGAMNAELAIETSGHCAMQENDFLDDGTYTAVQIVSLLAREKEANANAVLLDLIADLEEMDEVAELRMPVKDGSLETMQEVFDLCTSAIEHRCSRSNGEWTLDEENLEGIRVRLGNGQFFMLRKSLHDPLVSLQIESESKAEARRLITDPLVHAFSSHPGIVDALDTSALDIYGKGEGVAMIL